MYLKPDKGSLEKFKAFISSSGDCEQLSADEWVVDIYEPEPAVSLNIVFEGEKIRVDGAEYMAFSEELDGWYICGGVSDGAALEKILRDAGAY